MSWDAPVGAALFVCGKSCLICTLFLALEPIESFSVVHPAWTDRYMPNRCCLASGSGGCHVFACCALQAIDARKSLWQYLLRKSISSGCCISPLWFTAHTVWKLYRTFICCRWSKCSLSGWDCGQERLEGWSARDKQNRNLVHFEHINIT